VKVAKILGVVFGALFLLTGIALLAGSAVFGAGQGEFDRQLAEQGLAGPANGTVTAADGTIFTVDYVDKNGLAQTGMGPVAEGTTPPEQGDDVQVYYSTLDPSQIIILDFPGGNFAGVAGLLRTIAIVCLIIGAVLLVAGIIGLVTGRRQAAAANAVGAGYPAVAPLADQAPGPDPAPSAGQAPPPTTPPGPDIDPTPTQPFRQDPNRQAPPSRQDPPTQSFPQDPNRQGPPNPQEPTTQPFGPDQNRPGPPSRQDPPTQEQDPEFNRPGG
jgi:hypothetical protein